ncbi:MAG: TonB-dependent receptor [Bacteroidales bacterium]|jgi:iron complex outermembrane receptor protein|nr:TonB-dependent receptor [Bacteroidales bacterium]
MKHTVKKTQVLCFKRWENKSYSAFKSLHKCVKIGVLCAGYSLVNIPEQVLAQTTDSVKTQTVHLEEVDVNAESAPDIFAQTGRTITQVSRTEIHRAPAQTLTDLLKYIPAVDLRQRGPYGSQADLSIRGSSFDQTLILLNGINLSDPQTGHYALNLPIDLESVERIEVLEGPASRIFGNNALGGAVNFITGTGKESSLNASLAAGQYGYYKLSLASTTHLKHNITHHTAISKMASDGYMKNTDFDQLNIFSQNKWENKDFPLDLQLGYSQKSLGANGFYAGKYPQQEEYESLQTCFASLKGNTTGKVKISPSLYWRRNYDHYVFMRHNPSASQNFHFTDVFGGEITASVESKIGKTNIGLLSRHEKIFSSNLGKELEIPRDVKHDPTEVQYTHSDERTNFSLYGEQNLRWGKWSASAGILLNHNNYTGSKINLYPGIDLACYPSSAWKLYGSVNRAMRLPTFTDLYYHGYANRGNPDLKPEQCLEYELGAALLLKHSNIRVSYFYRNTIDAIDWIWLPDESVWHTMNLHELQTQGISSGWTWDVQAFAGSRFWLRSVSVSYDYLLGSKANEDFISNYALDYLKHKFVFHLDHRIVGKLNANWKVAFQDRNGNYMKFNLNDGTETATPYDAFWQIDLRVYYDTSRWNIFAEASNLTDQKHHDLGNLTLPGIWVRGGINIKIATKK